MRMKYLLPVASAVVLRTALAKEWRLFHPKADKQYSSDNRYGSKATKSQVVEKGRLFHAKAGRSQFGGKSTQVTSPCGLWHRSITELNPNSCTNDDKLPDDPTKLYVTMEECCKTEFGKVHGCHVYSVCHPTSKPTPVATQHNPKCGVFWHRSTHVVSNTCTDDETWPDDPSKLYTTVQECCIAEFGESHGCNINKVSCDNDKSGSPTPYSPFTGDEGTSPTGIPTSSPKTENPMMPIPGAGEESSPPSLLLRKSLAAILNEVYESGAGTQNRGELQDALEHSELNLESQEFAFINVTMDQQQSSNLSNTDSIELFAIDENEMSCKCVHCPEDTVCGDLWSGNKHYTEDIIDVELHIHIVVSHCKSDLDWLDMYIEGFAIESIHIISKCGYPIVGAPESAIILELDNIGRCDHSYAWYILNILPLLVPSWDQDNSVIVFLKDDMSHKNMHQSGDWSELRHLLNLASNDQGFACGIDSMIVRFSQSRFSLSAYHETKTLTEFAMDSYQRNYKGYDVDNSTEFKSQFETLGAWWKSLGIKPHGALTQVCYGGAFAASVNNIRKQPQEFWESLATNLSRGNNIQEGHYAERSWALLMTSPLEPFQEKALSNHADGVYINMNSMHGALMQLPKLFLHVGAKATTSTEILSKSLINRLPQLRSDGYRVAVHGKYNPTEHDFPNVDRLASCMWSDQIKQSFIDYMREATICPDDLLPDLTHFMHDAVRDHHDLVISNQWLSRQGTADSLALYLNPVWETHVIVYYRRYYEWITIVFEEWRLEILGHASDLNQFPFSSFRFIDFIREYCKRLFYGKDVNEDGYPIRPLSGVQAHMPLLNNFVANHFDPSSNSRVEDLTDLTDYAYFVAKEYSYNPRFRRHVTIVNYHEAHNIETNFFCHVLHDANNACRAAVKDEFTSQGHVDETAEEFLQKKEFPIRASHAAEDLVIAAFKSGRIKADSGLSSKDVPLQLRLWIAQVEAALHLSDKLISEFPLECLYNFELERLLEVSLAYEKSLLPVFYDSIHGATNLVQDFRKWRFCSIDTAKVLNDTNWNFIFDLTSNLSKTGLDELI